MLVRGKKSCRLYRLADPEVARMSQILPGISDLHPHASLGNVLFSMALLQLVHQPQQTINSTISNNLFQ
jgi:hypothetical protein